MEWLSQLSGFPLLLELLLKSTIFLIITLFVVFLLRKHTAAARHFILALALIGLLIIPLFQLIGPQLNLKLIPQIQKPSQTPNQQERSLGMIHPDSRTGLSLIDLRKLKSKSLSFSQNSGFKMIDVLPAFLILLWLAGIFLILTKIIHSLFIAAQLTQKGKNADQFPWNHLVTLFLKRNPLKRRIKLMQIQELVIPMTWGVLKPVILIPDTSKKWPVDQCSTILHHELFHIKRNDFLVKLMAWLGCCLFWFNPLAWFVFKQLKKEQEKACDELVINTGIKPSTYATYLLRMKRLIEKQSLLPSSAIGMAGQSAFSERLITILKKQLNLKEITMKTKIIITVLIFFSISLIGSINPFDTTQNPEKNKTYQSQSQTQEKKSVSKSKSEEKVSTWVTKEDEKKKKGKMEKKQSKKYKFIIKTNDKGNGKLKEIISTIDGLDAAEIKLGGDYIIIIGKDKSIKKIPIKGKSFSIFKGDDVYIESDGDDTFSIITKKDGKKLMWKGKKGKVDSKDHQHIWISKKEKGDGESVFLIKSDGDISLNKNIESLNKTIKKMEKGKLNQKQKKNLKEIKNTLQKMEKKLKESKKSIKLSNKFFKKGDKDSTIIFSSDGSTLKAGRIELKHGHKGNLLFISKPEFEDGIKYSMILILKNQADAQQKMQLKKALSELKKKLSKDYKVESKFGDKSTKITIKCSDEEIDKITREKNDKLIKAFTEEVGKIFPSKKGNPTLLKEVYISKEKEEEII